MNTSLTDNAISLSMLDGYLAAVASGPNLVMPDQVLRWVWATGQPADRTTADLVIRHYQAVIDALNDKTYVPHLADPHAWCRGYMAGVAADMMAWAPLTAAKPEVLKMIMSGAGTEDLAEAARRIHAFWVALRWQGKGLDLLGQLAALAPGHTDGPNQTPH